MQLLLQRAVLVSEQVLVVLLDIVLVLLVLGINFFTLELRIKLPLPQSRLEYLTFLAELVQCILILTGLVLGLL